MNSVTRQHNLLASFSLISFFYVLYTKHPYFAGYFSSCYSFFGLDICILRIFDWLFIGYAFTLLLVFILSPSECKPSKSLIAFNAIKKLIRSQTISAPEKVTLLSFCVKGFYIPLMVAWLTGHCSELLLHLMYVIEHTNMLFDNFRAIFQTHLYWLLLKIILFFDVLVFTLGYLIEHPKLKNEIRSVDSSFFGWAVTLACYPPFNEVTHKFFQWHSTDQPLYVNSYVFYISSFLILFCMGIYSWASVSLGLKASNLTHRGIVSTGAYAFIRHPAYIMKNMAWWIGVIPAILAGFQYDFYRGCFVIFCMSGITIIYFLRAITEERHLLSVDDEYAEYMKKVPYRFIPHVF